MDMEQAPSFQEFLKLLQENGKTGQEQDLSLMAWYLADMERQFDAVVRELHDVKAELAQVTQEQSPSKKFLTSMVEALEKRVEQAKQALTTFQDRIVSCAKEAVGRFKDAGVSALDNAVAAMGVKNGLEHLQKDIQNALAGIKETLEKAESMGAELRQAGHHLKNASRIAANRETSAEPMVEEGRFQAAVLAPMRGAEKLLSNINNNTLAAIGVVEDLEQSADVARSRQETRAAQRPGKRLEKKPSIRQALREKQAEIAARAAPAPDQEKRQEAAL